MKSLVLLLGIVCAASASDIGTIKGTVTDNGSPVKATIHILRDGYSGIPQAYETIALGVVTPHYIFGTAITFPLTAPGVYTVATSRKGAFAHSGLPAGTYSVAAEVGGKLVEQATGVVVLPQRAAVLNFEISAQDQTRTQTAK